MTIDDALTLLTTAPPAFSPAAADIILREQYGVAGTLKILTSERDQNFLVEVPSGESCVLKIANSAEVPEVTEFQTAALLHVADADKDFPVPRVLRTREGETQTLVKAEDGRAHSVRLLTWLEGTPLRFAESGNSKDSAGELGAFLARLGTALRDFEHPASEYTLLWDLKHAENLLALLDEIDDEDLRKTCRKRLHHFALYTLPALNELRTQAIYNDLNPSNVLVDPNQSSTITGIIDFGDLVRSPLIIDVAVAAAYLCEDEGNALSNIVGFLQGYHRSRPLQREEVELLYDLILTRSVMTIVITHWRVAQYPQNRDYILRNEPRARSTIEIFASLGQESMTNAFLRACRH